MTGGFNSIEDLFPSSTAGAQSDDSQEDDADQPDVYQDAMGNDVHHASVDVAQGEIEEKMQEIGLDNEEDIAKQRAAAAGLSYIDLSAFPIGPEVISLIPETTAKDLQGVTFFRLENQIRLGVVDPDNPGIHTVVEQLEKEHPGSKIQLYVISPHSLAQAMRTYKSVVKVKKVQTGVRITAEQLQQFKEELTDFDVLQEKLKTPNLTDLFAMLISMALNRNSSDVHIEAEEHRAVIRFRIDGVLTEVAELPAEVLGRLVSRIKSIAGLKINVSEVPQDGRITIKLGEDDKLDIRVSTLPSAYGESIVFRLLKSSSVGLSFEDLGIRPSAYERLKTEIEKPNGMILTTGPTGSGKTTTLYAILNKVNTPENKVITLENPVEYKLKGIVQSQIDHSKKYTFGMGLRSILRQDPDIVMVGEIRDLETATTAVEASLTGHLLLSTVHTNDAAGAVPRLMGMGVKPVFLAPALNAVIGQRLVRTICKDCKTSYTPEADELTKAKEWLEGIPENAGEEIPDFDSIQWMKGKGCQTCGNTGYKGRIGIYEIFTMNVDIEKEILEGNVSEYEMKRIMHDNGTTTMGQDGVLKAADGITTLEEVFRVAKA